MSYNYKSKKIVAIISETLENWQSMNILGHMAIALGANKDSELIGREVLTDKDGNSHVGIARFGFIIKKGTSDNISNLIDQARKIESLKIVDFPREMLDTRHDDELAESMVGKSDFEYLGVVLYGDTESVDRLTKSFRLF